MTEQEWLQATDPRPMLEYLHGKVSERKRRLLAIACCHRIWHLLEEQASRDAIEEIEHEAFFSQSGSHQTFCHAPSAATDVPRNDSALQTEAPNDWEQEQNASTLAAAAVAFAVDLHAVDAYDRAASAEAIEVALAAASARGEITGNAVRFSAGATWNSIWEDASAAAWNERWRASYLGALRAAKRAVRAEQAGLLKDLFGNPIRQVNVEQSWLRWNGGVVLGIARTISEQRSFDLLCILADALEEAGCEDQDILRHCRQPGEHVRGCWVVDVLLGKSILS